MLFCDVRSDDQLRYSRSPEPIEGLLRQLDLAYD